MAGGDYWRAGNEALMTYTCFKLDALTPSQVGRAYTVACRTPRMTGKILVLTAIDDELDKARAPERVEVIYSGVGKVNAASAATLSLGGLRPSLIINYGTAGKIREKLRGPVAVAHGGP